jgi:hypothetical protein
MMILISSPLHHDHNGPLPKDWLRKEMIFNSNVRPSISIPFIYILALSLAQENNDGYFWTHTTPHTPGPGWELYCVIFRNHKKMLYGQLLSQSYIWSVVESHTCMYRVHIGREIIEKWEWMVVAGRRSPCPLSSEKRTMEIAGVSLVRSVIWIYTRIRKRRRVNGRDR